MMGSGGVWDRISSVSCVLLEGALGCQCSRGHFHTSFIRGSGQLLYCLYIRIGLIQSLHSMGRDHRICGREYVGVCSAHVSFTRTVLGIGI